MARNQYGQYYVGNDDFRGWLAANNYRGKAFLDFTGNDGGTSQEDFYKKVYGKSLGGVNLFAAQDPDAQMKYRLVNDRVRELYNIWQRERVDKSQKDAAPAAYGGGVSAYNPYATQEARQKREAAAAYDNAIRESELGMQRLGEQQRIGEQNIYKQAQNALNDTESNFNQSKGMYQMQTRDAIENNKKARDQIEQQAASRIRSAKGQLAAGGAGDSSFAHILAPFRVAEEASRDQSEVQDQYARNRRDMDINYAAVENAYKKNKKQIEDDKMDKLNRLKQTIQSHRAEYDKRIAEAKAKKLSDAGNLVGAQSLVRESQDRRNQWGREIDALDLNKAAPTEKVEFKAPALDSYAPKESAMAKPVTTDQNIGGVNDQIATNLQPLLDTSDKKKKKEE